MGLVPGTRLGAYEIIGPLGAGGMGEVYRAADPRLGREVAVKVLPQALLTDPSRLARLDKEARLLASLNHPNIASIYDVQESGNYRFMVLELVPGETLMERLAGGPLPVRRALEYALQIAGALEAAHSRGIVHRDLKPANVMITPGGMVKILDFGLAKDFELLSEPPGSATFSADATAPGTVVGTFGYMSPEQARGQSSDNRTDVWAFGCVLFEMLSGRRAFPGATLSDRIAAILVGEPEWDALPRHVPPVIKDMLRRCFEKDAGTRAASVSELKGTIAAALSAGGSGPANRGARWRVAGMALAAAVLVAVLAVLVSWWTRARPAAAAIPAAKIVMILPFKDLSGTPTGQLMGDGMVETLSSRLAQVPGLQVVTPAEAIAAADKNNEPFQAAGKAGASLLLQGSVQQTGERIRITFTVWNSGQRTRLAGKTIDGAASDLFGMQDRLVDDVIGALKVGHGPAAVQWKGLETAAEQARYVTAIGRLQRYDREASVQEGIRELAALAAERPDVPIVQAALARAYLTRFRLTRDRKSAEEAIAACRRAQQLNPDNPDVDITLGELQVLTGEAREAARIFERVLAQQPNSYPALLGLADAQNALGNTSEAVATCRRAIDLQPSYWGGYSKLAGYHFGAGDYPAAIRMFVRVTGLCPDNARAFGNLGAAYQLNGDLPRALEAYNRSLALSPTPLAYSNIGTLNYFSGRFELAAEAYEAALRLTPENYELWANLGDACRWAKGRAPRAAQAYAKAIELCEGELRLNPGAGEVRSLLAAALAKTGRVGEAQKHIQQALAANPGNPELLHDAAVVAGLAHRKSEALAWLMLAVRKGYPKVFLERDPEFESLRAEPAFKQAIQLTTESRKEP